jgi:hypothetical protein
LHTVPGVTGNPNDNTFQLLDILGHVLVSRDSGLFT